MHFNAEKTEEIISSTKRNNPNHPILKFGGDEVIGVLATFSVLRKQLHPLIYLKKFQLNVMFLITYDVIVSASQVIELSALQARIVEMSSLNGMYWIQISRNLTRLRPSRANYLELSGRLRNQCTTFTT